MTTADRRKQLQAVARKVVGPVLPMGHKARLAADSEGVPVAVGYLDVRLCCLLSHRCRWQNLRAAGRLPPADLDANAHRSGLMVTAAVCS